jgi:hypothetical protein
MLRNAQVVEDLHLLVDHLDAQPVRPARGELAVRGPVENELARRRPEHAA